MKLGITMEGGASRTVFSCGVTDCFLEENIMPDYFIGVSAGIAFGMSYLSGQKGRNRILAEEYMSDKRYMGMKYLFDKGKKTFYNIPFVFGELPNEILPFDFQAFKDYPGEVEAGVTNIHTGKAEYLTVPRDDDSFQAIVASCALPVLFQPVKVGKHYYMDGALADSVPFLRAVEKGCDKNIVILTREKGYRKKPGHSLKMVSRIYQSYPNLVDALKHRAENYNLCMREWWAREKAGEVFIIAPDSTLGVGRTESDPGKLHALYEEGYYKAKESIYALKKYLEK